MKKNTEFTLFFSLFKTDGTLIANPGTYTKKVSIDGGAMADITASVTEEDTTYGQLSVVLSAAEMNGTAIWISIKDDTDGCIPYIVTLYPDAATLGEIKTETASILEDTGTTLDGKLNTIDDFLDTEIAAITAAVITNAAGDDIAADIIAMQGNVTTIMADTDLLDDAAGGIADIHTDLGTLTTTVGAAGAGLTALASATNLADLHTDVGTAITAIGDVHATDLPAVKTVVDGLATTLGAAGAGLTAVPWNAAWDAEVQSECADALTAYGFADDTDVAAAVRDVTLAGAASGGLGAAVADVLTDTGTTLDTLIKDIPTVAEFEARTIAAADYLVATDTLAAVTTVGSVTGSVGSVTGAVGSVAANGIGATSIAADAINAASIKTDAVTKVQNGLATPTNITAGTITTVTNLTNAPTTGDLTAAMKSSVTSAVPTAAAIADAVWDEVVTTGAHDTATYAGAQLLAASSAGDPWATALPGAYGAGTAGLLLGTTIPTAIDAVDNYVDTEIGALTTELAKVPKSDSNVTWNATALASIQQEATDALNAYDPPTKAEMDSAHATTNGKIDTVDDLLDTEVAAIKSVVDSIRVDTVTTIPGKLTTMNGKLDTIDDFLDTEIAAILEDTAMLEKWVKDKLAATDNGDGTITYVLYDTDNTTPLLTWVETTATNTRAKAT